MLEPRIVATSVSRLIDAADPRPADNDEVAPVIGAEDMPGGRLTAGARAPNRLVETTPRRQSAHRQGVSSIKCRSALDPDARHPSSPTYVKRAPALHWRCSRSRRL